MPTKLAALCFAVLLGLAGCGEEDQERSHYYQCTVTPYCGPYVQTEPHPGEKWCVGDAATAKLREKELNPPVGQCSYQVDSCRQLDETCSGSN